MTSKLVQKCRIKIKSDSKKFRSKFRNLVGIGFLAYQRLAFLRQLSNPKDIGVRYFQDGNEGWVPAHQVEYGEQKSNEVS